MKRLCGVVDELAIYPFACYLGSSALHFVRRLLFFKYSLLFCNGHIYNLPI
jgi:hypothetical protein